MDDEPEDLLQLCQQIASPQVWPLAPALSDMGKNLWRQLVTLLWSTPFR